MDDILQSIDPDKRERIINASVLEFASLPYEKASTNNIVKNAGISKGLLFHYFSSKKQLYEAILKFVIFTLYHAIADKINWEETDLFERIKQIAIIKLEVNRVYPHMYDFMQKILVREADGSVEKIMVLYKRFGLDFEQLYKDYYTRNVDYSKFSDKATIAETINIVRWSLEKYAEEKLLQPDGEAAWDFEQIVEELNHYLKLLKNAFYV